MSILFISLILGILINFIIYFLFLVIFKEVYANLCWVSENTTGMTGNDKASAPIKIAAINANSGANNCQVHHGRIP